MYISEDKDFKNFDDNSSLFWKKTNVIYGDWYGGPNKDGSFTKSTKIVPSAVVYFF